MANTNNLTIPFKKRFLRLFKTIILQILPYTHFCDCLYSLILFIVIHKRFPNKSNGTLNDVLFFIKTTKEIINPLRVFVTDKEFVKLYIKAKVGEEFNVPTVAVLRNVEDALSFNYPQKCVIKPTHLSSEKIFRVNGEEINFQVIKKWFKTNYYYDSRETNYKSLLPKLIVEPFVFDNENIIDYKIFCFNGKPCIILVVLNTNKARNIYTLDWELLPFTMHTSMGPGVPKPKNLNKMLQISSALSKDFNHIRVDLYSDGNNIFVGELTNCHWNASVKFTPPNGENIFWQVIHDSLQEKQRLVIPLA